MGSILNIEAVASPGKDMGLTQVEIEAMLQIAYLATAVDGKLGEEEADALERAGKVLSKAVAFDDLFNRYAREAASKELGDLLDDLAGRITRVEVRELTYKLAYALSLADLDTNDDEEMFTEDLRTALGISEEGADALIAQVIDVVSVGD